MAKEIAKTNRIEDHFADVSSMIDIGCGPTWEFKGMLLSRHANTKRNR
jgi:hypothetical protein